ncbi:hypothetical protein N665_0125s0002 [Sinapis alba]|nr:hypothetical protein N665_0125s0002 [Sinapis alba]
MSDETDNDIFFSKERATADQEKTRDDILVIELTITNIYVMRLLVDTGSSADILFKSTLERMGIDLAEITEKPILFVGFSGEAMMTLGFIYLAVKAGSITKNLEFLVIDFPVSYNAIMGTPWLNSMRAIPLNFHLCVISNWPWNRNNQRRSESITSLLRFKMKKINLDG